MKHILHGKVSSMSPMRNFQVMSWNVY